jgi:hypothetical protein
VDAGGITKLRVAIGELHLGRDRRMNEGLRFGD